MWGLIALLLKVLLFWYLTIAEYIDKKGYALIGNVVTKLRFSEYLTFEKNNKHYWLEHLWNICKGIHKYNTKEVLLLDVRKKFIQYELNNKYEKQNLVLYNTQNNTKSQNSIPQCRSSIVIVKMENLLILLHFDKMYL